MPFDVAEGESEIVAGFHVEYAGITFGLFFLGEYMNMILISMITTLLFCGGWLSPFQGIPVIENLFAWVPGVVWLLAKMSFLTSDNNQSKDSLTESRKQLMGKYDFQIPDDFNETPQELIDSINKPFAL